MKRLALILGCLLIMPYLAYGQVMFRASPTYTGTSNTLLLYVSQFDEYNVTLTANTPIQFSVPVVTGTVFFRINTCQNSTGGFTPTFTATGSTTIVNRVGIAVTTTTASACDTEYWTYRNKTNQLILEFVSFANGSGSASTSVINVQSPPYNAAGTNLVDDTAAIQNAIYDACNVPNRTPVVGTEYTATKAVYLPLPSVCYKTLAPTRDICQNLNFYSDKNIKGGICASFSGNSVIAENELGTLHYGTSLVTGPGNSLVSESSPTKLVDLMRYGNTTNTVNIDEALGRAGPGFNWAFFMKPSGTGDIMCSQQAYPGSGAGILCFSLNGSSKVTATINTSGGTVTMTAGCAAQTTDGNHVYEVELDWDQTNYRLWQGVPGGTAVLCNTEASANPPIRASIYEEMTLPYAGTSQYWPDNSSFGSSPFNGFLDSIRVESMSLHTSAYTVPTIKFTADPYTWFVTNFEASVDGTQLGYDELGGGGNVYLTILGGYSIGYVASSYFHDIEFCNNAAYQFTQTDGLFMAGGNGSIVERTSCSNAAFVAYDFWGNDFWMHDEDNLGYGGYVGFNRGPAYNHAISINDTVDLNAGAGFVNAGGGVTTNTHFHVVDRGALKYFGIENSTESINANPELDAETGANTAYNGWLLNEPTGPDIFDGGVLGAAGSKPFIQQDNGGAAPIIRTTAFAPSQGTPNYLIDFTNGTPTTQAQLTGITNASSIALSNLPEWVQSNNVSFVTNTQMQTITCNSALDGQTFGFLVKDATTCTTGSAITGSGSTYCTAICNKNVSSGSWVH